MVDRREEINLEENFGKKLTFKDENLTFFSETIQFFDKHCESFEKKPKDAIKIQIWGVKFYPRLGKKLTLEKWP